MANEPNGLNPAVPSAELALDGCPCCLGQQLLLLGCRTMDSRPGDRAVALLAAAGALLAQFPCATRTPVLLPGDVDGWKVALPPAARRHVGRILPGLADLLILLAGETPVDPPFLDDETNVVPGPWRGRNSA